MEKKPVHQLTVDELAKELTETSRWWVVYGARSGAEVAGGIAVDVPEAWDAEDVQAAVRARLDVPWAVAETPGALRRIADDTDDSEADEIFEDPAGDPGPDPWHVGEDGEVRDSNGLKVRAQEIIELRRELWARSGR